MDIFVCYFLQGFYISARKWGMIYFFKYGCDSALDVTVIRVIVALVLNYEIKNVGFWQSGGMTKAEGF